MGQERFQPQPYPSEQESDVVLRDGSTVRVRPVRGGDEPAIRAFLDEVTPESIAFRFFGIPNTEWIVAWSVDVDYDKRFALVAESGASRQVVAHAAYVRESEGRAEVAFLVADRWQGRGISTNPAGASGGGGRAPRDLHVHGRDPALEPSDDRGVPGERLSGRPALLA